MENKILQVITLGCSKNTVDTEHLLAQVQDGYTIVPESYEDRVDYLLINTCGFIEEAKKVGVNQFIITGTNVHSSQMAAEYASKYPNDIVCKKHWKKTCGILCKVIGKYVITTLGLVLPF